MTNEVQRVINILYSAIGILRDPQEISDYSIALGHITEAQSLLAGQMQTLRYPPAYSDNSSSSANH